ncbi:hypothetical protein P9112_008636 [Eukaryota sp. TZLM1-RC]
MVGFISYNNFKHRYPPDSYALVTGANSGIGLEYCRYFASQGIHLIMIARSLPRLKNAASEILSTYDVNVVIISADLSDPAAAAQQIISKCANLPVSIVVNNAGYLLYGSFGENEIEDEIKSINTLIVSHLKISFYFYKKLITTKRTGLIIFISSILADIPLPQGYSYSAAKAFTSLFGEGLFHDAKRYGIDVVTVKPGPVKQTRFLSHAPGIPSSRLFRLVFGLLGSKASTVVNMSIRSLRFQLGSVYVGWGSFVVLAMECLLGRRVLGFVAGTLGRAFPRRQNSMDSS